MRQIRAAALAEVTPGAPHLVVADDTRLVLVRVGDRIAALAGTCTHQGGPLGDGKLSGTRLTCPWHGWMFDVRTGQCLFPPRGTAVASYPVRIDGDDVWVELPTIDGQGPSSPTSTDGHEPAT